MEYWNVGEDGFLLPSSIFPLSSLSPSSSSCFPLPSSIFPLRSSSSFPGSMVAVRSSTSTKTGVAPQNDIASAVAMKVLGTVMTSSPGPTPSASSAIQRASVPLPTPTHSVHPQKGAKAFSNSATKGPPAKAVLSITACRAEWISGLMASYWAFRSRKGTCMETPWGIMEWWNDGIMERLRKRRFHHRGTESTENDIFS